LVDLNLPPYLLCLLRTEGLPDHTFSCDFSFFRKLFSNLFSVSPSEAGPFPAFSLARRRRPRFRALGAAQAFWEEVLPFTDFVPTATLAWTFVTSGSRRRLRDAIGGDDARLRGSRLMAGIRGVPAVDRRAYEQAEAYLTPKKELLDE